MSDSQRERDVRAMRRSFLRDRREEVNDMLRDAECERAQAVIERRNANATIEQCDAKIAIYKARIDRIQSEMNALKEEPVRMVPVKAHMRKIVRRQKK